VILASELTGSVLIRYLKLFLPWIKFICVIHANAREYTQHSRIFLKTISILNKISYLLVDKYVCVSNYLVNEYLSLEGIPRSRIAMIYNGLKLTDSPSFPKTRQKPWKIAYIGRLSHEKGFDIFLQVVKRFIPEINDYQFHIFGNGKYLLDQAKLVENGFPGLIKNHGFVSNLYDHLKKIDCVIVPSRTEGCPYNVLEAFSYEIPVISFDVGGLPELIKNNETGILCKFGDIDAMVFGIKKTKNADFRDYLVRNASEFMKRFSVEIMRKKYVDLIKSL